MPAPAIVEAPTATRLPPEARGGVLVTGSHGGVYPGRLAVLAGVRAAIFHDAGIGLAQVGIGSLALLGGLGIAALTVAASSARIGEARSTLADGVISAVNAKAEAVLIAWTRIV